MVRLAAHLDLVRDLWWASFGLGTLASAIQAFHPIDGWAWNTLRVVAGACWMVMSILLIMAWIGRRRMPGRTSSR
jgi:hypothetical protein